MDGRYTRDENASQDNSTQNDSGSLYSYNYRDGDRTVHQGDYYEDNDWKNASDMSYRKSEAYNESVSSYDNNKGAGGRRMRRGGFGNAVIKCMVIAAVFGLVAGGVFCGVTYAGSEIVGEQQSEAKEETSILSDTKTQDSIKSTNVTSVNTVHDVSDVVDSVMPAIVAITNMSQTEYYNVYGQVQAYESRSAGSGIIVDEDDSNLYIVTNNHVVYGAKSLTVAFDDDNTATATVKGVDEGTDLAVITVSKSALSSDTLSSIKTAKLGDSTELKIGEPAIAIGNALGYGQSVTTGVISALDREVTTDTTDGMSVTNKLIQTDAAINPGNSGGALLDINGEVIGINSAKYSDTDVEGMGYAIPISSAQPIIEELIKREKVDENQSGDLGITGMDVSRDVSSAYNIPQGVYVLTVADGSAAHDAGITSGDIITEFDDHGISSMKALENRLKYYSAGSTVDVTVKRAENGIYKEKIFSVTLGRKTS